MKHGFRRVSGTKSLSPLIGRPSWISANSSRISSCTATFGGSSLFFCWPSRVQHSFLTDCKTLSFVIFTRNSSVSCSLTNKWFSYFLNVLLDLQYLFEGRPRKQDMFSVILIGVCYFSVMPVDSRCFYPTSKSQGCSLKTIFCTLFEAEISRLARIVSMGLRSDSTVTDLTYVY